MSTPLAPHNAGASAENPQDDGHHASLGAAASAAVSVRSRDQVSGLLALPKLRSIPWIAGRELPPEKSTHSDRSQTKSAFLLVTRGNVNTIPCDHCKTKAGRFSECISLDGFYYGACATCQLGTRGHKCSLRNNISVAPFDPNTNTNANANTMSNSKPNPKMNNGAGPSSQSGYSASPQPSRDHKKREVLIDYPENGYPLPLDLSPYPNTSSSAMPYTGEVATREYDDSAPLNHIYKRRDLPHGTSQAQASGQSSSHQTTSPAPPKASTKGKGRKVKPRRDPVAKNLQDRSASPSAKVPESDQSSRNGSRLASPEGSCQEDSSTTPLIDTLPQTKQAEIYGIFGRLKAELKNSKRQAETTEKQLGRLEELLGINDTDDDADT